MATTTTVEGTIASHFSQQVLDLQASGFCCTDTDTRKLIRWTSCKPGVFKSSKTLFTSDELALCNWYQEVSTYNFITISLEPKQVEYIDVNNAKFVLAKASWPSTALESKKLIEVGIGEQNGYIGMTIPFTIGTPALTNYKDMVMKDLFHINTMDDLVIPFKFNNISPYSVSISILYAK
jgi:hypothetical protein